MTVPKVEGMGSGIIHRPEITDQAVGILSLILERSSPSGGSEGGSRPTMAPIEEAFRGIEEALTPPSVPGGGLVQLAKLVGGTYLYLEGAVTGQDISVPHSLKRVPDVIVVSWDLQGQGGQVRGFPAGGSPGPNTQPWTDSAIIVRVTRNSDYALVVI